MTPDIRILNENKLIGRRLLMSFTNYKAGELWRNFMPGRHKIINKLTNDLISLAVFPPGHFINFKPTDEFERWATVEVSNFENVPNEMETFVLPGGLYAVFNYRGSAADGSIFKYILGTWLPQSNYILGDRPHFEVLDERYKHNDPASEEEIWIPVKTK